MALNKFVGMGRLTKDPEMRRTVAGTAVTTFCIAVERDFKDKTTGKREADFINCIAWDKNAEHVARYFSKGKMAVVEGRIQTRNWTGDDGVKHYVTEVVTNNVYFGESKKSQEENSGNAAGATGEGAWTEMPDAQEGDLPF